MDWTYQKYNAEKGEVERCPMNDDDGSLTGAVRIGLKTWFDENPEVRKSLGYTKCIHYNKKDDPDIFPDFNPNTHYLVTSQEQVDAYTIKDVYHVLKKSEEMLVLEELLNRSGHYFNNGFIIE